MVICIGMSISKTKRQNRSQSRQGFGQANQAQSQWEYPDFHHSTNSSGRWKSHAQWWYRCYDKCAVVRYDSWDDRWDLWADGTRPDVTIGLNGANIPGLSIPIESISPYSMSCYRWPGSVVSCFYARSEAYFAAWVLLWEPKHAQRFFDDSKSSFSLCGCPWGRPMSSVLRREDICNYNIAHVWIGREHAAFLQHWQRSLEVLISPSRKLVNTLGIIMAGDYR